MRRSTILLAAALVALPALGAAQTTKNDTGKPAATSREKGKKAAPPAKSAASKPSPASPASRPSAASRSAGAAANPGLNPAARAEMLRRRSTFRYAADSCADGRDRCDHDLLDEAEKTFVNACRACDTVDRCEAERTAVRQGGTNVTTRLCVP
jgi:hypothetical protein